MSHTREWDETTPENKDKAGLGANEIIKERVDISERMSVDHYWESSIDDFSVVQDGKHKKVTMKALSADPTPISGAGIVYTKIVDGICEHFYMDDQGTAIQITNNGQLTFPSYPVACMATKTATQAISAAYTKVTFPSETYDVNNDFASSRFIAPVDSWYLHTISLNINSGTDSYIFIYKNGASVFVFRAVYTSSIYISSFVLPLWLEEDDRIEIYISSTGSYPFNVLSGSFLNIIRL